MPKRRPVSPLTAMIGDQIRHWRMRRGITQRQLAEAVTAAGVPMDSSAVANIETRRRDDVSMREVFAVAYVLNVPPALIMLPIGREDEVEVVAGIRSFPWAVLQWATGEAPLQDAEGYRHPDGPDVLQQYNEAALPLRHYPDYFQARHALVEAEMDAHTAEVYYRDEQRRAVAVGRRVEALRQLGQVLDGMIADGVRPPRLPAALAAELRSLGFVKQPEALRVHDSEEG